MDPALKKAHFMKAKNLFYQKKWVEAKELAEFALTELPDYENEITEFITQVERCMVVCCD
jgi:hypothetical protein